MFTALTFNMQNAEPWEGPDHEPQPALDRTIAFLLKQQADILLLQEVERGYDGGRQLNPPPHFERLRGALAGYHGTFAYPSANSDELPFGIGLAIFSRAPLEHIWSENLPAAPCHFEFGGRNRRPSERVILGATTELSGISLTLLNTHLQAFFMIGASSDDYPQQRNRVEAILRNSPPNTLLGGDFNCAPGESLLDQFGGAGFQAVQTNEPTWKRRPYAVDHLFYGSGLECVSREVIPTDASDHHAVRATFRRAK